jgi:phasin family protein
LCAAQFFLLNFLATHYIVHCNIDIQEAQMAKTIAKKTVKNAAVAPAKKAPRRKAMAASVAAPAAKTTDLTETVVKSAEQGIEKMTDTIKNTAAEAAEKATGMFQTVRARAEKAFGSPTELAKDVIEFHKGNFEALVEAGKVAANGTQGVVQHAGEVGRKNWDASTAHLKALTAVKSPTEFIKLQGEFARKQFDAMIAEASKTSETYVKLAGEITAPVQNRYAKVAEDVKARFAA